jgi:hypothetical protein
MGLGMSPSFEVACKQGEICHPLTRPNRRIGASKEQARREQLAEAANGGYDATQDDYDEMEF